MSFQHHREKTEEWRAWVRQHGLSLAEHYLPTDAIYTELDWFLFLDHGYIQSSKLPTADWWTINFLSDDNARWLAAFIEGQYLKQYPQLVAALRRELT
jgi:hypothetical protein